MKITNTTAVTPTAAIIIIIVSTFIFLSLPLLGESILTIIKIITVTGEDEKRNYENNIFNHNIIWATAQEDDNTNGKLPVIKNSRILDFTGNNYADVVNSNEINLNSFTISLWFKTEMNVTGRDIAFLLNKEGFGTEREGFNLNYGIWLDNRERITGGYENLTGNDFFIHSQASYADGFWHNAILTFDNEQPLLKLLIDGLEVAHNSTNLGIMPDTTGKQPVRLGANSFLDKGVINGNYTGQLDDIQVWDYAFNNQEVASLFDTESKVPR